ncbi:hypothetical protein HUJ04_013500 [Dendroctonus ponderosae]|nr:hypothetical protein HUJ04_013500 [Dendroctonus ponderosae]
MSEKDLGVSTESAWKENLRSFPADNPVNKYAPVLGHSGKVKSDRKRMSDGKNPIQVSYLDLTKRKGGKKGLFLNDKRALQFFCRPGERVQLTAPPNYEKRICFLVPAINPLLGVEWMGLQLFLNFQEILTVAAGSGGGGVRLSALQLVGGDATLLSGGEDCEDVGKF